MTEYFSEPKSIGANVNVEKDFSNYATKADLKSAETTLVDLRKLNNLVKMLLLKRLNIMN